VAIAITLEKTLAASFDTNQTIIKFTSPGRDPGALSVIDRAVTRNAELGNTSSRFPVASKISLLFLKILFCPL
jgi:hypothetical protein